MSNTSPLEPCPPDGAVAVRPFMLLEPAHDSLLSQQLDETKPANNDNSPRTSSGVESKDSARTSDEDSIDIPDEHLPPRPELQELVRAADIISPQAETIDEKRDSRISLPSADDAIAASNVAQSIYMVDEDIQLHLRFHRRCIPMMILWYTLCIVTAGIWFIVDNWANNKFWIRWNTSPTSLKGQDSNRDKLIRIKSKHAEVDILPLKRVKFPTPMPITDVFTLSLHEPYRSPEDAAAAAKHSQTASTATTSGTMLRYVDILEYRATSFLLHPITGKFHLLAAWRDPLWGSATGSTNSLANKGLPSEAVSDRKALFGPNQVTVKGKSVINILVEEVLHPFYIFQIYSVILWCNDDYVPYAIVIIIVSVIGIITTTITTKAAIEKLKKMSRFSCDVSVLRTENTAYTTLNSEELVPGDIIDLAAQHDGHRLVEILPCDVVLLEGDCIVNEAMLTGESVPVVKAPVSRSDLAEVLATGKDLSCLDKNVLYSGTKLIRVRPGSNESRAARGLVIRTGFSTAKGSLVRQMLFPRPISHKFYRDAFYFIGNLFVIAGIGMVATIIYFKIIGVSAGEIAVRSLDVLTIAVPPALPATLSICVTFSIARLKRGQIFCLSPQRINVAGMVNMFVFDKTGTLTEEGLDVSGIRKVQYGKFTDLVQENEEDAYKHLSLVEAMATAHDLNLLDDEPIGEPLEVKMLEWTGRTLQDDALLAPVHLSKEETEETGRRPLTKDGLLARVPVILARGSNASLAVIRAFEFTAALRRMSVVVKRENTLAANVYCKGAPESIVSLCQASTLPSDYHAVLDKCTRAGFRVLAVAGKTINALGWQGAQGLTRTQAESELEFLGLIVFENKLKPATTPSIATIREDARMPVKMCTGDSVLTAVSVGKECGMMSANAEVFTPRLVHGNALPREDNEKSAEDSKCPLVVEWISVDDAHRKLDPYSLDPPASGRLKDIELAISGEILRTLLETCAPETITRALIHCKIFGRFSPEQKQELVERLQTLGYVVAFTGDGANDCGALKSADVGLSLSEAEASVAAPFTSRRQDISAIDLLIREGRSTLSVSFAMFKWMSCYSLAEYFTVLLLYGKATSLDNAEYLYVDIFTLLPIAIGLANTLSAKKLFRIPPESRLSSSRPIVSMLGQVILGFFAQTIVYLVLHAKSWYEPPFFDPENLTLDSMDNTALFKVSIFSYIIAGFAFSLGPPHRQILCFNWILFPALVILSIFSFYFIFLTGLPFFTLFGFVDMPKHFFWIIFGVVIAQIVLGMVFEFVCVAPVAKAVAKAFNAVGKKLGKVNKKPYKAVEKVIYRS